MQKLLLQIGNPFMKAILRSPLHGLVSKSTLLITVKGRKSGKLYTTPVNYLREGDAVTVVSARNRTWWRNLRGGAQVTLRMRGQDVKGQGHVVEDTQGVTEGLMDLLAKVPAYARYYKVTRDANGQLNAEDVARAAETRVIVRIDLG